MAKRRAGFVLCLAAVVALQIWSGAYRVERGLYSDDAAHFMNGLLIRDYLTTGLGQNPMRFAEAYYRNYPKIAPLMWPPLFHVTLGLALLPGWPPGAAALLLVGAATAWLAWRLQGIVRSVAGALASWVAVGLLLTTQMVQSMSTVIMLDVVLAAVALEAAVWLARYAETRSRRDAVLFGLWASAACLTKGNGVALVLMPAIFMLLTWRFDLLRRSGLYIAAGIVLVLAVPLLALSARFDAAIGDFAPLTWPVVAGRVGYYCAGLWQQLGPVLAVMAIAGAVLVLARHRSIGPASPPLPHALLALAIAALVFHFLSPHEISSIRYVTMAIAPLIALALFALSALSGPIVSAERSILRPVVLAAVVVVIVLTRPALHAMQPLGFRESVNYLAKDGLLAGQRILVVSDEVGEGAFVTEVAVLSLRPAPTVVRGSKLLGSDDWMGRGFALSYPSPPAILADLESLHVAYVVLDRSRDSVELPYFSQVEAIAADEPRRFQRVYAVPAGLPASGRRAVEIYRVTTQTPGDPKPLDPRLSNTTFGRVIRQ